VKIYELLIGTFAAYLINSCLIQGRW